MALTKVSGHILDSNIDLGTINATSIQVGSGTTIHTTGIDLGSGNLTSHNINSTGIVTSTGSDINGDLSVSGNVSIGGTLTYEDVTNIDSVGVITARSGIHVTGESGIYTKDPSSDFGFYNKVSTYNNTTHYQIVDSGDNFYTFSISDTGGVGIKTNYADNFALKILSENENVIKIENNNSGLWGSDIRIFQNSRSPFANDKLFTLDIRGRNSGGNETIYNRIISSIKDPTDGSEDGKISFWSIGNGTVAERLTITGIGSVGIGEDDPKALLHVSGNNIRHQGQNPYIEFYQNDGTTNSGYLQSRSTELRLNSVGSIPLTLGTDDTERLRITSSGNIGIGTAIPRDKVDLRGGSFCMTGDGSNFRPHIVVRPSSGTTTIKYFEYYFDCFKSVSSPSAADKYILDITNISTFFQGSFEVVYGTRLQTVSDATTSTCTKTFGVNRFNSGNVAVTDENNISVDSNSNTHADVTMDALSGTAVRLKVAFSSTLGGASFCSGVVRGWGVFDVFREPGSGGANQLTFYNGV